MKIVARQILAVSLLIAIGTTKTVAAEASRFVLRSTNQTEHILLDRDHFSVTLIKGWVSAKDSFFKSLLSSKAKMVISCGREVKFFEGEALTIATLEENGDISKNTDRSWGQTSVLLNNVPAEAESAKLALKVALNRDDNISKVFAALDATKASSLDIYSAVWVGYAKVVGDITRRLFGTDETSFPFKWSGDIKAGDVLTPTTMQAHYLVLISAQHDGDTFLNNTDAAKLSYDETSQQLRYDNQIVSDHSYVVIKIAKAAGFNIARLITADSTAPWAVLAASQFIPVDVSGAENLEQLRGLEKHLLTQLKTEIDLLKREKRFSSYDRAKALLFLANTAKEQIEKRAGKLNIATNEIPTAALADFAKTIGDVFDIKASNRINLEADAKTLKLRIQEEKGVIDQ
ncbi:MAG: hypothetical protein QM813_03210 [Verrucomicrobiota bacterium]